MMKRNWIVIGFMFVLTVALWAQAAAPTPQTDTKAAGCACCNHDMKADAKAGDHDMAGCCGKNAKACSRKDAKGDCCAGMKKDAKLTGSASNETQGCCGKDCCKNGKCEMAKNGKKCCANCPGTAEGK